MAARVPYQSDYIPNAFGLVNNGSICYLNSLIQCLMSCSSITQYMIKHLEDKYSDNEIVNTYVTIYENHSLANTTKVFKDDVTTILREMNAARKKSTYILLYGQQEDLQEGLVLLLDAIGGGIESLFHVRYKCTLQCQKCKKAYNSGNSPDHTEPPELMIDLTKGGSKWSGPLDTQQRVENHIKQNINVPEGYKCDKCGAVNDVNTETGKLNMNVIQIYTLTRLSEILIIMFKKYHDKQADFFPTALEFGNKSGKTMRYRVVAAADHFGNMNGGHYTATALRNKPITLHNDRRLKIEKALAAEEKLYNQLTISDPGNLQIPEIRQTILTCKELLKKNDTDTSSQGVFLFNDDRVTYMPDGFVPTTGTYLVFYHLF